MNYVILHCKPFKTHFKQFTNIILPPRCLLCGRFAQRARNCCLACEKKLPWIDQSCVQCGYPLTAEKMNDLKCGQCLKKPPAYNRTIALCYYQNPIDQIINQIKFGGQLAPAHLLSELLIDYLDKQNNHLPDVIIPVPLHSKRLRERGFNQALEIARPIAKHFNLPLLTQACIRHRETLAQAQLKPQQRQQNLRDAFTATMNLKNLNVAVVDDVVTTGNTVQALSVALKQAQAASVTIWACARTVYTLRP